MMNSMLQVVLLWEVTSAQVSSEAWHLGQIAVRAHIVEDIVQNYTVIFKTVSYKHKWVSHSCGLLRWGLHGIRAGRQWTRSV
jgi:hypothetical protein